MTNKDKTMNTVKIFNHPVFGQVRIIEDDASSELLFCANDVTLALGYSNGRDAVAKHVDEGDVAKRDTPIPNQYGTLVNQSVTYITESGVYALIFGSKQERAKDFKRWVTSEVLPSIRKTGQYSVKQPSINEPIQLGLFSYLNSKERY
jgi:prophage antirepressor-like protein|nr:MAG TPA: repressor domain protein [Caudoviricetes sp.]